jgi:hypothetical protein
MLVFGSPAGSAPVPISGSPVTKRLMVPKTGTTTIAAVVVSAGQPFRITTDMDADYEDFKQQMAEAGYQYGEDAMQCAYAGYMLAFGSKPGGCKHLWGVEYIGQGEYRPRCSKCKEWGPRNEFGS